MQEKNVLNTLVLGLEHFIDKIGYQAQEYKKNGVNVTYLVRDKSSTSSFFSKKYSADVQILPISKIRALFFVLFTVFKSKPKYIEIYDTGNMFLFYVIISFFCRVKIVIIYRGGELQRHSGNKCSFNYIKHYIATQVAHKIIVKESNIISEYKKNNFPINKMHYLYNCVPLPSDDSLDAVRKIDLLFLNSIRKSRNLPFLIDVISELHKIKPDLSVVITGFNSLDDKSLSFELDEEQNILNDIKNKKLENVIQTYGFIKNPLNFYLQSKLFVFPADVVFANYSLLESMASGCVPIVSDGEGANLIVSCKEGEVVQLNVSDWVEIILEHLNNESLVRIKSIQARNKIDSEYSMSIWFENMMKIRSSNHIEKN